MFPGQFMESCIFLYLFVLHLLAELVLLQHGCGHQAGTPFETQFGALMRLVASFVVVHYDVFLNLDKSSPPNKDSKAPTETGQHCISPAVVVVVRTYCGTGSAGGLPLVPLIICSAAIACCKLDMVGRRGVSGCYCCCGMISVYYLTIQ